MQQTPEPIAKIPLETTPAGETFNPDLVFSPDGSVLYVRQPVVLVGSWDWVRWHAPEIGAVTLVVTLVWLAWLTRRLLSRRQELGCVYCRRCNYELTPPLAEEVSSGRAGWLSAEAKCPECGHRSRKAPVVGRLRRWRLLPWVIVGAVVSVSCVVALGWALTPLRPMEGPTWPVAGIQGWMPGLAYQKQRDHLPLQHRISRWEMPSGKALGTLGVEHVYGMNNGVLSPDGRVWAMGCWDLRDHQGPAELVFIDAMSRQRRAMEWSAAPAVGTVTGFSADSSNAYVQWTAGALEMPPRSEAVLEEVNVSTLARRDVARVKLRPRLTATSIEALYPYFLVDPSEPTRRALVVFQQDPGSGGIAAEITILDSAARQTIAVPLTARSWYAPRWIDSRTIELPLFGATQNARVDLETGTVSLVAQPPAPVVGRTPNGSIEARGVAKTVEIWTLGSAAPVTTLAATGGTVSGATFSADGRLVASSVTTLRAGAAANSRRPQDYKTEVWVWRLDRAK